MWADFLNKHIARDILQTTIIPQGLSMSIEKVLYRAPSHRHRRRDNRAVSTTTNWMCN